MASFFGLFMMVVPFSLLYGSVSRLPMIYAMNHMLFELGLTGMMPACIFAGYCLGRLIGASLTSALFGFPSMLIGVLSGLVAHAGMLISPASPAVFGAMVVLLGFTETVTGIDTVMKFESLLLGCTDEQEHQMFRTHFTMVTLGAVIAYVGGGNMYAYVGIKGIAWMGVVASTSQVVILVLYARTRHQLYRSSFVIVINEILNEMEHEAKTSKCGPHMLDDVAEARNSVLACGALGADLDELRNSMLRQSAAVTRGSCNQSVSRRTLDSACLRRQVIDLPSLYKQMSTDDMKKVNVGGWALVISYAVTAFPIGANFALMTLFWKMQWGRGTGFSGLLMSLGELLGLLVLVPLGAKLVKQTPLLKPFGQPVNLIVASLVSSMCVLSITIPNMWISYCSCVGVHIINVMLHTSCVGVHIINVMLHTFCNEIVAAWIPADVYPKWVGHCYIAKRLSNTSMAFVCTALFMHVGYRAAFFVIGGVVFVWSGFLALLFHSLRTLPWQQEDYLQIKPDELHETSKMKMDIERLQCQALELHAAIGDLLRKLPESTSAILRDNATHPEEQSLELAEAPVIFPVLLGSSVDADGFAKCLGSSVEAI